MTETAAAREGLRERKKRLMRELISQTATEMFLERGFDEVKVTEIAEACEVSEKTVYNYFPTKESLLLDREEAMGAAIRDALSTESGAKSPVEGALRVLDADLAGLRAFWESEPEHGLALFGRFTEVMESTPSLRAAQRDMLDRLVRVAAEAMAVRAGVSPDDPEPQIVAYAILGLWRVQFAALRRLAPHAEGLDQLQSDVQTEVRRAARLIDAGLWSFNVMVAGRGSREQVRAAAEAAQSAGRQVAAALREARATWKDLEQAAHSRDRQERFLDQAERHQRQVDERRTLTDERRAQGRERAMRSREQSLARAQELKDKAKDKAKAKAEQRRRASS